MSSVWGQGMYGKSASQTGLLMKSSDASSYNGHLGWWKQDITNQTKVLIDAMWSQERKKTFFDIKFPGNPRRARDQKLDTMREDDKRRINFLVSRTRAAKNAMLVQQAKTRRNN